MRSGDIEEAKSMFESVKTPLASFYLAKVSVFKTRNKHRNIFVS